MACQNSGGKTARLRQGDLYFVTDVLIRDLVNRIQKSQMNLNVTVAKNHLKHYEGEIYTWQSQRNVKKARITKD